ncbi:MAG: 4'-phosphopantetheinyl transferase superfamily protein [Oscillospiraceae bacterium]|nr:4'-phosphopantetheinyl transferase superfamily protein [Oscillospiraceae bacterium]
MSDNNIYVASLKEKYHIISDNKKDIISQARLKYSLCDYFKIKTQDIQIMRDEYRKPYLFGHEDMYFNISHSGRYWICACSDAVTGVDIECASKKKYASVIDSLHSSESRYIRSCTSAEDAFYNVWVRKEAVFKAAGTGILDELSSFSVISKTGQFSESVHYKDLAYYITGLNISIDSYSCLCTSRPNEKIKILYEQTL